MPQRLEAQILACRRRAEEAAAKAASASDPYRKSDYLAAQQRWEALAELYESTGGPANPALKIALEGSGRRRSADGEDVRNHAEILQAISTALIQENDIDALYERIVDGALDLMDSDFSSMQVFDAGKNELQLLAWRGFHPDSAATWDRIGVGGEHSACAEALRRGHRVLVQDVVACDFLRGTPDLEQFALSCIRSVQSTPLRSRSGELIGMISTHWQTPHDPSELSLQFLDVLARQAADLIERTRAEAQIVMLGREVEHRAINLLASVDAAVRLSNSDSVEGFREAIQGRLVALARVHRLHTASHWQGADLGIIVKEELSPYLEKEGRRVRIAGASVTLTPDVAQAVAIALHELTTNAAKYGALSVPGGGVEVTWSERSGNRIVLAWTESGGPPTTPPAHNGFGTRIMKGMRTTAGVEVHFDWRPSGLRCEITVPVLGVAKS